MCGETLFDVSMGGLIKFTLAATLLASFSACSDDSVPVIPEPEVEAVGTPTYDADLEPSAAVLALVPQSATTLTVTDYEQVRLQMGLQSLTTADPKKERKAFWVRAEAERPLLSTGMLRESEPRLEKRYGLSQLDVDWEAHFFDAQGEAGYVLVFREGTKMAAVEKAVDDGVGPLAGATVDRAARMVSSGTIDDGDASWAADQESVSLVGLPANSTYLARGCVEAPVNGPLEALDEYSVQFEGTLVTARLGSDRLDLFTRMRAAFEAPEFAASFGGGVADPLTGRIGYVMNDPAAAADLALDGELPFAACA